MRISRSTLAVASTVVSLAAGGGVAWACGGGSGATGSYTGTTGPLTAGHHGVCRHSARRTSRTRRHTRRA